MNRTPKEAKQKTELEQFCELQKQQNITYKTKKVRFYPTKIQREILRKWFGTYRFIYNFTKEKILKEHNTRNFMILRDAIVTKTGNTLMEDKEWTFETPKEIRASAIKELLQTLTRADQTKQESGKQVNIKFKTKKNIVQTIRVPKSAYRKHNDIINVYPTILGGLKIKEKDYAPEVADCDLQITYRKPNIWHILIPVEVQKKQKMEKEHKICALDGNVRNLVTGVGSDGNAFVVGDKWYETIKRHEKLIAKLQQKLDSMKHKECRVEYLKTKNVLQLQNYKIQNLMNDFHNKAIKYLTDRYDIIIFPHLKTSKILTKSKERNKRTMGIKHYQFRVKLQNKCECDGKYLIDFPEHYTTKACSNCGCINHNVGKSEVFNCPVCHLEILRDINSAKNIFHKTMVTERL